MMYKHAILTGLCGLALTFGPPPARADDKPAKGQTITATGCLTKDTKEKDEFMITGEDGKTWGLKSDTVKLNAHLNHKVTVTGKVTEGEHGKEAGDLNVSNLKMVSDNCK